jgi:IclR family mhp operon transcriptional activator
MAALVRNDSMATADKIRGLERGLRVLQTLQSSSILSLHEIHQATRISKPSLLRILNTLEHVGLESGVAVEVDV